MQRTVHVYAPATVANVACGFDILGFALSEPGDEVIATVKEEPGVTIVDIEGDDGLLPRDPLKNAASVAASSYLSEIKSPHGLSLKLRKQMPVGSGLGSSAASAAAGVFAAHHLLGNPHEEIDLVKCAMEGERVSCGSAHADNVAPALLGGFTLVRSYSPLDIISIPAPKRLICTVVHPAIEVRTEDARKILRERVLLRDAITQMGNVAGLIAGLIQSNYELIGRSLHDVLVEPERAILIPGFHDVKKAALDAGALGCGISGSGPSMFALSTSNKVAQKIGASMKARFQTVGIRSSVYVSRINVGGPKIITEE